MIQVMPVRGIGEIRPGDDLALLLGEALACGEAPVAEGDVLVVTQKIVSKAEGRFVDLGEVVPGPEATAMAALTCKDSRFVELVMRQSSEIVRAAPNVLIARTPHGHVMANAGIDQSNLGDAHGQVLLLPEDPDRSAVQLRDALSARFGVALAVVICDSFGRPWRTGVVNVAIGASGFPVLVDLRGELDRDGRSLQVTQVALGDMVAAAAGLAMGEGDEGVPAALVRGVAFTPCEAGVPPLIRPLEQDLFR